MKQSVESERVIKRLGRREILKLSPLLLVGAVAIPRVQSKVLGKGLAFSDWISSVIFREEHLAETYPDSSLTPFDRFPINTYDVDDPEVDLDDWTLPVEGKITRPGNYTLAQIKSLPLQRQNTAHICVEGWRVIGQFGGTRLSNFLNLVGADTSAKYVYVDCDDDYYESLDMKTALHPQTLLCYEMYEQPLTREHGAPLRLSIPTKLGYKSAKYLTRMRITDVVTQKGYWEDQGYSDYAGI